LGVVGTKDLGEVDVLLVGGHVFLELAVGAVWDELGGWEQLNIGLPVHLVTDTPGAGGLVSNNSGGDVAVSRGVDVCSAISLDDYAWLAWFLLYGNRGVQVLFVAYAGELKAGIHSCKTARG
jgi:hypothetical protein